MMDAWMPELTISPDYIELHRVTVACTARDIVGMCAHLGAHVTGWIAAPMDGDPGRRLLRMEF
jgi:hypothetical protein